MKLALIGTLTLGFAAIQQAQAEFPLPRIPAAYLKTEELHGLITGLSSPDYKVRENAGKELYAKGDIILPVLRKALETMTNPEGHRRLQVIVETLHKQRLVTPRTVTLNVLNEKPKAIFEQLAKQSGYDLAYNGSTPEQTYTYNFHEKPFWEAFDIICRDMDVYANSIDTAGNIQVYSGNYKYPFTCYSGPFKVVATNINFSRSIQLIETTAENQNHYPDSMNLSMNIYAEPKTPLLKIGQATITRATDDMGNSLVPTANHRSSYYYGSSYRTFYQSFSLYLTFPSRDAKRITEIAGTVPVTLLSETRPELTLNNILTLKDKRCVGRTAIVEFKSFDYKNDMLTIEATISKRFVDPNNQYDYTWSNSVPQRFEIYDDEGNKFNFGGLTNSSNSGNSITATMQFRKPNKGKVGKPHKLHFVEWVTLTQEIEFSFKEMPLP